jgi:hypothetical protein
MGILTTNENQGDIDDRLAFVSNLFLLSPVECIVLAFADDLIGVACNYLGPFDISPFDSTPEAA